MSTVEASVLTKKHALALMLTEDNNYFVSISSISKDEEVFTAEGCEYLVLDDKEADSKAKEYILQTIWAFNDSFIAEYCGDAFNEQDIKTAKEGCCEESNGLLYGLIKSSNNLDLFTQGAIDADGRGHFLALYDSEERESNKYFIYRTN